MNQPTPAPSPFSATLPTFQTTWDSTSLSWLKQCGRLYQYQMLQQWEPRGKGIHLYFGGMYASGLERYSHAKASGLSHDESTLKMVRWVLENSGERVPVCQNFNIDCEEGAWPCIHCEDEWVPWSPTEPDANIKNRFTLIRSLIWNVEERQDSPFKTLILANGKPAVELTFNFAAFEIGGHAISLSGHLDEVVEADDDLYIRDDKTTKGPLGASYFSQYSPNNQMSLYSVAGRIILDRPIRGVLVKAAQIGVNFTRFQTQPVPRSPAILDEWMKDTEWWIGQAHQMAQSGHWPMNDKSCFLCSFKSICKVSPSHREAHLKADFVQREWNPLSARGDI